VGRFGDLSGRVVLVTGGNSGIGLAIARACGEAGSELVVWGTNAAKNASAASELQAALPGRRVVAQRVDVSDEAAVVAAFGDAVATMGRVDCVFANAGVGGYTPFVDMTLAEWRRVTSVNLDGAFLTLREAARHMVGRGDGGSLVAVSSVSAHDGAPAMEHYAASKAALLSLMRALAVELARHRVRCNSLSPGWVKTEMNAGIWRHETKALQNTTARTPVRRWAEPHDMADAAVFLADPSYLFHTGTEIVVDGGYTVF
jgi:NAD(P)-dependent dehydrogenase (short-subunit alcohol dehydrogenase family)